MNELADWNNTAVIVPAYEAAAHIGELARRLGAVTDLARVLVIDDGSTDDTAARCQAAGFRVICHGVNRGKGAALQTGLQAAYAGGSRFAFSLDADLQHEPEAMPLFLEEQRRSGADLVYGRRNLSVREMPWPRVCSNRLTSNIVSYRAGQRVHDSQCGYRVYRLEPLAALRLCAQGYQLEPEVLLQLAKSARGLVLFPYAPFMAKSVATSGM